MSFTSTMHGSRQLSRTVLLSILLSNVCLASQETLVLRDAEIAYTTVRDAQTIWAPFSLPYLAVPDQPGPGKLIDFNDGESVWFRLKVPDDLKRAAESTRSLYIWRHNIRLAVYLEDRYLGGTDRPRFGQPSMAWNHPLLLDLPPAMDHYNYLYIHVTGGPSGPILSPVVIGNRSDLSQAYEDRYFVQVEASQWAFAVCLVLGIFSLWLWSKRRQDILYLQFSVMSFLWCITNAYAFLEFVPINMRGFLALVHSATDWSFYLLVAFTLKATGIRMQWLEKLLLGVACIATALHVIVPDQYFFPTAYVFHAIETLAVIGVALIVVFHTISRRGSISIWFPIAFIGMWILMGHDFYVVFLGSNESWITASNWMHLSFPLIAVAFYSHLITRFVGALNETEALNTDLEARVRNTRTELEAIYQANREMEIKQAANAERGKIYRDLHDDVGSKLVSIVQNNQNSEASNLARGALESIRKSIYRANHDDTSLRSFIEKVDEEISLRAMGAGLGYSHRNDTADCTMNADVTYHLSRIFREVVSNTLHHAKASIIHTNFYTTDVSLSTDPYTETETGTDKKNSSKPGLISLHCEISDDGSGFGNQQIAGGGLENIHYRAREIGAEVTWENTRPGTRFYLSLIPGKN